MENYKSPVNRLVHLFKKGRDVWKERAAQKQKRIRTLEVKTRDISLSRDNWKHRAIVAEKKLSDLETLVSPPSKKNDSDNMVRIGEVIPANKSSTMVPAIYNSSIPSCREDSVVRIGEGMKAEECATQVPLMHQYPVFVIQLAIEQFLTSFNSFRGCRSTFEVFAQFFSLLNEKF